MFSLEKAKLIRLNDDGSERETFQTNESSLSFGTSADLDYCVDESDSPTHLAYKIYKDDFGTVSRVAHATSIHLRTEHSIFFYEDVKSQGHFLPHSIFTQNVNFHTIFLRLTSGHYRE